MRSASDNSGTRYEEHEAPKLEHFGGPKNQPARTLNLALILDGVARLAILVRPSSIREVPAIVQCHDSMQEKQKHFFFNSKHYQVCFHCATQSQMRHNMFALFRLALKECWPY